MNDFPPDLQPLNAPALPADLQPAAGPSQAGDRVPLDAYYRKQAARMGQPQQQSQAPLPADLQPLAQGTDIQSNGKTVHLDPAMAKKYYQGLQATPLNPNTYQEQSPLREIAGSILPTQLTGLVTHELADKVGEAGLKGVQNSLENASQNQILYGQQTNPGVTAGLAKIGGGAINMAAGPVGAVVSGLNTAAGAINRDIAAQNAGQQVAPNNVMKDLALGGVDFATNRLMQTGVNADVAKTMIQQLAPSIGQTAAKVGVRSAIGAGLGVGGQLAENTLTGQQWDQGLGTNAALMGLQENLGGLAEDAHERIHEAPHAEPHPAAPAAPSEPPIPNAPKRIAELSSKINELRDTINGKGAPGAETPIPAHSQTYEDVKNTPQMKEVQGKLDELRGAISPHETPNALKAAREQVENTTLHDTLHTATKGAAVTPTPPQEEEKEYSSHDMMNYINVKNTGELDKEATGQLLGDKQYVKRDVPIDSLGEIRGANGVDQSRVDKFAQMDAKGQPAIVVGSDERPIDGKHRILAAQARGDSTISAYVPTDSKWNQEKSNETVVSRSNPFVANQENPHGAPTDEGPQLLAPRGTVPGENVPNARPGSDEGVSKGIEETANPLSSARRRAGFATIAPSAADIRGGLKTAARKVVDALHAPSIRDVGSWLGSDLGLDRTGRKVANDLRSMFGRQDLARARMEEQFKPAIDLAEKLPQKEQMGILSSIEQHAGQSSDPRFADYAEQRHAINESNHERMLDLQKRDSLGVGSNVYDLNKDWVGRSFEFPDEKGKFPGESGYDSQSATRSLAGKEDALRRRKFDTLEDSMSAVKDLGGRPKYNNLLKMALSKDISVSNSLTAREAIADLRDQGHVRVADLDNPIKPGEKEITDRTGRMADRRFSAPYDVAKDLHDSTAPLQKRIAQFRERFASGDIQPLSPSSPRPLRENPGEGNLEATGSGQFRGTLPKGHVMIDEAVSRAADPRKMVARRDIAGLLNNVSDAGTDSSLMGKIIATNKAATKLKLAVSARHYLTETMGSSGEFYGQSVKDLLRGKPIRALQEAVEGTPGINVASALFRNKAIKDAILHGETGEAIAAGGGTSSLIKSSQMFKQPDFEAMQEAMNKGDLKGTATHFLNGTLGKLNQSLFDHFIPMMRRHVMAMKAESELSAQGGSALKPGQEGPSIVGSDEFNDLMAKHAKGVSNLMGVEDDRIHFQNKLASTVGHALFGVPNWSLGKLRATADIPAGLMQALKGKNFDPAVYSAIGGLVTMAGVGEATYMLMHNGQTTSDWKQIRRPGGWEIPSPWEAVSDTLTGHTGLSDIIRNRLAPLMQFATDMANGHNNIGQHTRDNWQQIGQSLKDDFAPISAENVGKAKTPGEMAASFAGLSHSQPAKYESPYKKGQFGPPKHRRNHHE